jgi:UPF0271 protein
MKKSKIFIMDTSVILSGKPINLIDYDIITTPGVSKELKPGGRDYQFFQFLKEKGLTERSPSKKSLQHIKKTIIKTGDIDRLSNTDIEILSLAYELKKQDKRPVILTDDFSIQNIAEYLGIEYEGINQLKITKKFKWYCRCRGCGKKFQKNLKTCPICGAEVKKIVASAKHIRKSDTE